MYWQIQKFCADDTQRFAIVYWDLNAVTFPFLELKMWSTLWEKINKRCSVLDLTAGFYKVPLDAETKY